ncbi:response regulator [Sporomusa aerivorans]|uniref:response regulator n=1 Tax=Sporomusa aerivorans TaxID=204936 RepID=UPI00352BB125
MRILIAEDDLISRKFLSKFLAMYGECDITVDGSEALEAYLLAWRESNPYQLACLDIMMPKVDGLKVLKTIRNLEQQNGVLFEQRLKIIMTTALADTEYIKQAFASGCDAYAAKPVDTEKFLEVMKKLGLAEF